MKCANLFIMAIVSIICSGAYAFVDPEIDPRGGQSFRLLQEYVEDNPLARSRAERDAKERAANNLQQRNKLIESKIKREMDATPVQSSASACKSFNKSTRYEAAALHFRLGDLVSNNNNGGLLTNIQLAVLTEAQKKVAQGWVDYARRVQRNEFVQSFSPDSCSGRTDKMTDSLAESQVQALKWILNRVERYNYNAI